MLFNCFALCLFHLLLPLPPCFLLLFVLFFGLFLGFFFVFFVGILFSPLYATMIAIVMIVFIIVVFFCQVRVTLSVCNLYQGQVARQAFVP